MLQVVNGGPPLGLLVVPEPVQVFLVLNEKMLGKRLKAVVDILAGKCGRLEVVAESLLAHQLQGLVPRHGSVFLHVREVTDQVLDDVFFGMVFDFDEPLTDAFERLAVGDVEAHKDGVTFLIEEARNGPKTLLAGCVPDLELDVGLAAHYHAEVAEFDPDCYVMFCLKHLVNQAREDAALAHAGVADDDDLEERVLVEVLGSRARKLPVLEADLSLEVLYLQR